MDAVVLPDMNEFFSSLGRRFAQTAVRQRQEIAAPELDPAIAEELLQLARVVAHGKERSYAPLASYMAGVAAERLRRNGVTEPAAIAAYVRAVRESLERELSGG